MYDCASNAFNLQRVFGIAIDDMKMGVPNTFCKPCYLSMERAVQAIEENVASRCMVKVYDWSKQLQGKHLHIHACRIAHLTDSVAGQKKKQVSRRKTVQNNTQAKNLVRHIEQIAPPQLFCSNEHPEVSVNEVVSVADMLYVMYIC